MKRFYLLIILLFSIFMSGSILPDACYDSDGDCSVDNIRDLDSIYEAVDLLTNPFGWLEAQQFFADIPSQNTIDAAFIHVYWFTDINFGAENINIDYWNSTHWVNCAGPFTENESLQLTTCNLTHLKKEQLFNSLKVRIRGQDTDGFPNAFAYIDLIELKVNHSAPPFFGTSSFPNKIFNGEEANISVKIYDDIGLGYVILSTNETGEWINYTDGTYGSPIYFTSEKTGWANFTWKNNSFFSGDVAWKIYAFDITGKANETNGSFFVQYKRNPLQCLDSDGDCNVENLQKNDGLQEMVDLLTFPFGWLEIIDWDTNVSRDVFLSDVKLVFEWKTDIDFGASNIYIDYWDGSWKECAGPFTENESLQETFCLLNLSYSQFNSLKVRIRGQDTDGFPNAFIYVENIYLLANFTPMRKNYLIVDLITPKTLTFVAQNHTFMVNATVYCEGGNCGNVSGIVRYNASSIIPDTPISGTPTLPLYIVDGFAEKKCPTNPLDDLNEYCNLTWKVNATGESGSAWQIGVLFNSTNNATQANHTINATIEIQKCIIDVTVGFSHIDFGEVLPNSLSNPALGNNNNIYNITIHQGSCELDIWIKGEDLKGVSTIYVSNISWNTDNEKNNAKRLTYNYSLIKSKLKPLSNVTTYYWLDMPPTFYGRRQGNITIMANKSGE
ncbi:MAG: hypothetical protein N3E38_02130 [Candidatus Aenigmarchaeota archaeon]|nr:hypothetical protein [Candidatus Aenigmarchaeota archaeon]